MVQIKVMQNLDIRVTNDPAWALRLTPGFKAGAAGDGKKGSAK